MGGFGAAEMKQGGEVVSLDQFNGQTVSIDWSQLTHSHASSPACLKACVAWLVADDAAQLWEVARRALEAVLRRGVRILLHVEGVAASEQQQQQQQQQPPPPAIRERRKREASAAVHRAVLASVNGDLETAARGDARVRAAVSACAHSRRLKRELLRMLLEAQQAGNLRGVVAVVAPEGTENDHAAPLLHSLLLKRGIRTTLIFGDGDLITHGTPVLIPEQQVPDALREHTRRHSLARSQRPRHAHLRHHQHRRQSLACGPVARGSICSR